MNTENQELNKHAELSRWCIDQADNYLRRRNNIQASEKGWGAAAQALKAIAEERGWNHGSHTSLIVDGLAAHQVAVVGYSVNRRVKKLLPELECIRGVRHRNSRPRPGTSATAGGG